MHTSDLKTRLLALKAGASRLRQRASSETWAQFVERWNAELEQGPNTPSHREQAHGSEKRQGSR